MPMSMRIESTAAVAAAHNPPPAPQPGVAAATSARDASTVTPAIDPSTGEPVLPKFPWISHLSVRLQENAQREKVSPFAPAEIAGETLNKLA